MKSCLIIFLSLLLSSFMIHEARGMSLRRGSLPDLHEISDIHQNIDEEDDRGLKIFRQFVKKFSGRSRKLIVSPTSSTIISAKNVKNEEDKALANSKGSSNKEKIGKKEEKLSVNSSSSQNQEVYPDVMDIAGMDYSQARRRPPIHN